METSLLSRATEVIDLLASDPSHAWTITEIASATSLAPATCHRLLNEMRRLGWADQRRRRAGYRLGPRAWALTSGQPYRAELIHQISPTVRQLSDDLGLVIIVAGRRGQQRQTLAVWHPNTGHAPHMPLIETDDLLSTSGGRLLLAMAPRPEREAILAQFTYPLSQWGGILTPSELRRELADLRRQRWCTIQRQGTGWQTASVIIPAPDRTGDWVTIGAHAPLKAWATNGLNALKAVGRQWRI